MDGIADMDSIQGQTSFKTTLPFDYCCLVYVNKSNKISQSPPGK